jgi:hypothetical protein
MCCYLHLLMYCLFLINGLPFLDTDDRDLFLTFIDTPFSIPPFLPNFKVLAVGSLFQLLSC